MEIIATILVLATLVTMAAQWLYFRGERRRMEKYPFYELRDRIVWEIVATGEPERYSRIYAAVNSSIGRLETFNFRFYAAALTALFEHLLDVALNENTDPAEELKKLFRQEVDSFTRDYVKLITSTARTNSLLLRLAMTNLGFRVLCATSMVRGVWRFLSRHGRSLAEKRRQFRVVQSYSYLGHYATQL